MRPIHTLFAAVYLLLSAAVGAQAQTGDQASQKDKDAFAITLIERAANFLAEQEHFEVSAEIWEDIAIDGKLLQFSKTVDAMVKRPNKLRMDIASVEPTRSFFYNGSTVTMLDHRTNFYGTTPGAADIDETIVLVDEKLDVEFPMEDILFNHPFGNAARKSLSAQYLGVTEVLGTLCHHVAFQHELLDWQAWIETGPRPVLRKLFILHQQQPASPATTAIFSQWDFLKPMPDFVFDFTPMAYQSEIKVEPPAKLAAEKK